MDAYWDAAIRLRAGQPLFPAGVMDWSPSTYHYAPWFAWLWVPVTYLPYELVRVGWSGLMLVAALGAAWPIARLRTPAAAGLAALLGAYLVATASGGNVQPLVVLALVWGLERRSGPLWLGVVASLKFFPGLFVLVYLGRRQFARAAVTVAVAGVLAGTFLLVDLTHYPRSLPDSGSLANVSPVLFAVVAVTAVGAALFLAFRRSRYSWLGAALSVLLASPRLIFYDMTYLLAARPVVPRDETPGDEG